MTFVGEVIATIKKDYQFRVSVCFEMTSTISYVDRMMKDRYINYITEHNREGSNKATSYIRALDLLDQIVGNASVLGLNDFWSVSSIDTVTKLYEYALENQKKDGSVFLQQDLPPSYGRNGYYSAALKSFQAFLIVSRYENQMWDIYRDPEMSTDELARQLARIDVESAELLVSHERDMEPDGRKGEDAVREVKARIGQDFFRKMILEQYSTQCCVTGLNIPQVLRASHITGWADDVENRLNPANGLCLSATYDAAFDKHLISFDNDCRIILSADLKEHYTNQAFNDYFLSQEGRKIFLPHNHLPDPKLLAKHRDKMSA